jgi:hypothetical protein
VTISPREPFHHTGFLDQTSVLDAQVHPKRTAATVLSPRTSPQDPTPRLVVITMLVLRYRCDTTWNRAEAASAGSGR